MRDYEKSRRQRAFREAEMNQMKSSFAEVLGLPSPNFHIKEKRLTTEEQYRAWINKMNEYNKQKGRWVDERDELRTQHFSKSDSKIQEEFKEIKEAVEYVMDLKKAADDDNTIKDAQALEDDAP